MRYNCTRKNIDEWIEGAKRSERHKNFLQGIVKKGGNSINEKPFIQKLFSIYLRLSRSPFSTFCRINQLVFLPKTNQTTYRRQLIWEYGKRFLLATFLYYHVGGFFCFKTNNIKETKFNFWPKKKKSFWHDHGNGNYFHQVLMYLSSWAKSRI